MRLSYVLIVVLLLGCQKKAKEPMKPMPKSDKIVIAHRGASGYLPEHTLAGKAMAYAMQPDYIEQDLVLSKDNIPIVLHDIYLDEVTDVAEKFPNRKREDGRYYVIDFAYEELKLLQVFERFDPETGQQVYPRRFPKGKSNFQLHSLYEEIELIQGLNQSTTNDIGIYPEIKKPAFHLKEGKDITQIVLNVLALYGYSNKEDNCILQCFDNNELKRIRRELQSELFLVQLIESEVTKENLEAFSSYADGVGPWYKVVSPQFIKEAQELGLKIHGYTFRADDLGDFQDFDALLDYGFNILNLDGIFTDHPDRAVSYLHGQESK